MTDQATHQIKFLANPTQKQFILSRASADLFSSRMGEGKSAGIAWACWHHTRHNPGAKWAIIRDTWENLRRTTQQEFFYWFAPGVFGRYKATEKCFYWSAEGMRGEVNFLGLDDPEDASKLQSLTLAGFGIDEPSPALETGGVDQSIFDIAMTRLRQPGMKWYAAKLAQNNPDETHWTYKRFVDPGSEGFVSWQTREPENLRNLPENYYEKMRANLSHRPDLWKRFGEGKYGYQQVGIKVTPEWNDDLHLARGLKPVPGRELVLLWDFGLHPCCCITQISPLRHWNILEAQRMDGEGTYELIELVIKPILTQKYGGYRWTHSGDPTGSSPEQSSKRTSAVKVITRELGGPWIPGPTSIKDRVDPLRAILRQTMNGIGVVQVDRDLAKPVWHALRGGWHRHMARTGVISPDPVKNEHSHPGDCMGYGAARLFPLGKLQERKGRKRSQVATFFGRPGVKVPKEAQVIGK